MLTSLERLNKKILPEPNTGCWLWTGCRTRDGYAQTRQPGSQKKVYAHRLVYELSGGVIPSGYELDHTCFVPDCTNPDHLRPILPTDNRKLRKLKAMTRDEYRRRDAERHRNRRTMLRQARRKQNALAIL